MERSAIRDFIKVINDDTYSESDKEFARTILAEAKVDIPRAMVMLKHKPKQYHAKKPPSTRKGVTFHPECRTRPWQAKFGQVSIGYFATQLEASYAHDVYIVENNKNPKFLNFP